LPGWLQAVVLLLFISQGLQTPSPRNGPSFSANADQTSRLPDIENPQSTTQLSRFAYTYNPAGTIAAESKQPMFQYANYYAHAPGTVNVTPVRAYDPTPGRWVDRDPLPANP
jgi:hypothetical protein